MTTKWTFPRYLKTRDGLIGFLAMDKMVLITNQGRNTNAGVVVDYYTTRRMVLKHKDRNGELITQAEFIKLYRALFEDVLQHITQWQS
jgi:hypothetical protein